METKLLGSKLRSYPGLIKDHFDRCWSGWAAAAFMILALNVWDRYYQFNFAFDRSLDVNVAILKRGESVRRDEFVGLKLDGDFRLARGRPYLKRVAGVAGDVVTWSGQTLYINGIEQAKAKDVSKAGEPLERGYSGVIPQGHVFVLGTHPDSFDSRYALFGLVSERQFIGKAVWLL